MLNCEIKPSYLFCFEKPTPTRKHTCIVPTASSTILHMGLSHRSSAPPSSSLSMHAFILLLCCGFLVVGGNNETDRLALLEFKAKITQDPFGLMTSWNDSIHFCQWKGVTCSHRHQRITVLDLQSSKLVGSISPHVGNLSF